MSDGDSAAEISSARFLLGCKQAFSGLVVVISSNMETDMKRRAGLVGLYLLIAIIPFPPD